MIQQLMRRVRRYFCLHEWCLWRYPDLEMDVIELCRLCGASRERRPW